MKVKIKQYNAVASWRWNIKPNGKATGDGMDAEMAKSDDAGQDAMEQQVQEEEEEEEEDVCGICRVAFEGCCPNCKVPGDDCPLIFGECTHIFHLHCLLTWLNAESSKNQCPMDRQPWVTAAQ